jgi:hypothetical protein
MGPDGMLLLDLNSTTHSHSFSIWDEPKKRANLSNMVAEKQPSKSNWQDRRYCTGTL